MNVTSGSFDNDMSQKKIRDDDIERFQKLIASLLQSREGADLVAALLPAVISLWAGKNPAKKIFFKNISRNLNWEFSPGGSETRPLSEIFSDPGFAKELTVFLPRLATVVMDIMGSAGEGVASLSVDEKKEMLAVIADSIDFSGGGKFINSLARTLGEVTREDPAALSTALRPLLRSLFESIDFGEMKETLDTASEDISSLLGLAGETLVEYPAKLVCLLAMVPALFNIIVRGTEKNITALNSLSPDLLADVINSLLKDVNGPALAELINGGSEIIRKIFTGSALIGRGGEQVIPAEIFRLVDDTVFSIDAEVFFKARRMQKEFHARVKESLVTLSERNPELAAAAFRDKLLSGFDGVRDFGRRIDIFEAIFSDDDGAKLVKELLGELDMQEIAGGVNRFCEILNTIHDISPEAIPVAMSQFTYALDPFEAGETMTWLAEDVVTALKPVAPQLLPPLINGVAEIIETARNEGDEMEKALERLRRAVEKREVVK